MLGGSLFRGRDASNDSPFAPALRLLGGVVFFLAGTGLLHLRYLNHAVPLPNLAGGILAWKAAGQPTET